MTLRLEDPWQAGRWCTERGAGGATIGFVPTMGALHAGHLALVARARRENSLVVVSIFVNPLQFDDARDFQLYARDFERDAALLERAGCDLCFTGTLDGFFPEAGGARERIAPRDPGPGALGLEGEFRPGHFAGVATIVARLFELTHPLRAYFGEKDFQQTLVVRHVAQELGCPEIVVCPTVREVSGLALSSRNLRLSAPEREQAVGLSRALRAARAAWRAGQRDAHELGALMRALVSAGPLELQYAEVRDPEHWTARAPAGRLERAQGMLAALCGEVRLIDTLRLDQGGDAGQPGSGA